LPRGEEAADDDGCGGAKIGKQRRTRGFSLPVRLKGGERGGGLWRRGEVYSKGSPSGWDVCGDLPLKGELETKGEARPFFPFISNRAEGGAGRGRRCAMHSHWR